MDLLDSWNNHKEKVNNFNTDLPLGEKIFKELDEEFRCSVCRDRGFYIEKGKAKRCSNCDGIMKKEDIVEKSKEELEVLYEKLNIPEYYLERNFDPSVLKNDENLPLEVRRDIKMDFYINQIVGIYDYFVLGKKLENSFILMSPQGNSKSHFVFSCIREALKHGLSVSPYYDTSEIHKFIKFDDIKLKELLETDIVFIKVVPAFVSKTDTQVLKFIMDKRARRNLPTIVTSRFNMGYLGGIEPHLSNNIGLLNVDKGDYSKLKSVLGAYPRDYSKYSDKSYN